MNIYTSEVEYLRDKVKQLEEALTKQEHGEPVAWMKPDALCDRSCMYVCTEGFTKFPECATKNEWVSLTVGETAEIAKTLERGNFLVAIKNIEAKLKEKNT